MNRFALPQEMLTVRTFWVVETSKIFGLPQFRWVAADASVAPMAPITARPSSARFMGQPYLARPGSLGP